MQLHGSFKLQNGDVVVEFPVLEHGMRERARDLTILHFGSAHAQHAVGVRPYVILAEPCYAPAKERAVFSQSTISVSLVRQFQLFKSV